MERGDDLDAGLRPFAERAVPPPLRPPGWFIVGLILVCCAGVAFGALTVVSTAQRVVRAIFFGSAFGYLGVSLVDFAEHFRLEKRLTGRYLAATALPIGETLNHAATGATLVLLLVLARPPGALALRDWFCLAAPAIFLALGWRDEIVYHRRRSAHREDILHTVAHLAAGTMMSSFVVLRMVRW